MYNKELEGTEKERAYTLMVKKGLNETTSRKVATALLRFCEFRNSTPDALLEEAKSDLDNFKDSMKLHFYPWLQGKVVEGHEKIEKPMMESSAHQLVFSKLASYFSHQGVNFGKGFTPDHTTGSLAIQADQQHEFVRTNEDETETIVDKSELKMFLNSLSPRDRAVGLCILSSSQDPVDVLSLTVGEFLKGLNHQGIRFFWDHSRQKTGVRFQVFFSVEATQAVKDYLQTERKGCSNDEPLFIKTGELKENEEGKKVKIIKALEPYDLTNAYYYNSKAIGLEWDKGQQNPFRPKRLRHYFISMCDEAKIPMIYRKIFAGHTLDMNEKYVEIRAKLEIQYAVLEPFLLIFQENEQLKVVQKNFADQTQVIEELKETISDVRFQRDSIKEQLDKQKNEMSQITEMIRPFNETFEKMQNQIKELQDEIENMRKASDEKLHKEVEEHPEKFDFFEIKKKD